MPFAIAVERVNELTNERKLRGVCVGYVTKERSGLKQFFTRRAIVNGGVCLVNDATNEEIEILLNAIRERLNSEAIYVETRNFNDYSRWREAFERARFEYKMHLNFHIDCTDKEAMWERLSEVRRRQVKKARATVSLNDAAMLPNEPQASLLNDENDVRAWYAILEKLYRTRVKTPLFPETFFLEAYRQGIAKYLLVKYRGKVIGGMMIVELTSERINELTNERRGCVYEWYICGLDTEYKEQYPSVMATWAAMEYANEHGLARFDVMGAGVPGVPYGVRDFKAEFGGKLVEQGRFLCVCRPWLYRLGTFVVKLMKRRKQIKPF